MVSLPKNRFDDDIDFKPVKVGKYKNKKTPEEISLIDPGYVVRLYERYHRNFCSTALYRDCKQDIEKNINKSDFIE